LIEYRVNEAIADDQLALNFPEGTEVHNFVTGEIIIWGKAGPDKTFSNLMDADKYYQLENETGRKESSSKSRSALISLLANPIVWINAVGLGLITFLIAIRRRLRR
jgi:hypothetical protein